MLSKEDNERLTRVGPGTPMGELLRELWTPALLSASVRGAESPKPFRLLGEDLVAYRDNKGRVNVLQKACPHRRTSLTLARNEGDGIRCIFHGWKFNGEGKTLECPTEPPDKREAFASRVPIAHYPAREAGGLIWIYMGKRTPPKFYDFEANFPPAEFLIRCARVNGNWLQGFEGQLDSAHLNFLHSASVPRRPGTTGSMVTHDSAPRFEFIDNPCGFREAALRDLPDGNIYARIREVVLPYYSFIPGNHGDPRLVVIVVPIDDEWSAHWYYYLNPFGPVPDYYKEAAYRGTDPDDENFAKDRGNASNNWNQNNHAIQQGHFSGIMKNFVYEDFIVEESMGPIMDRSKEFLGTSDAVIVRTRRMLLRALEEHALGKLPFGIDQDIDYRAIRALAIKFPKGADWRAIDIMNPTGLTTVSA